MVEQWVCRHRAHETWSSHPGTHPLQEPLASRQAHGKAPQHCPVLPSTATHCGTQNDKAVRVPVLLPELQHLLQGEL